MFVASLFGTPCIYAVVREFGYFFKKSGYITVPSGTCSQTLDLEHNRSTVANGSSYSLVQTVSSTNCSVLFFSRPRYEGWPHHGHTFSIYLCPLSFWLTLPRESFSRLDVVHPGRAWSSSPACIWHCSLHYLFLQVTPLFPHGVTIVC